MTRSIKLFLAVLAVIFSVSCTKSDPEGTYSFTSLYSASSTIPQANLDSIIVVFQKVEYFSVDRHYYTGKYNSEVLPLALNDFFAACKEVDKDEVEKFLAPEEFFRLTFINIESGELLGNCTWLRE